ncbi:hypothetical protein KOR34_41500 [Posidoniimonas corsicana]|uniref:Uncharacterized protein n=1 Tax=Posidoniimonas corsicana TaxID=1938618 RepID=A0A5C5V3Q7_9BACT|nr:hypothetical protein [Posidoniimonas corsicana]TWT32387.1 hypothetical protein KOR34_41500 [Posidoniimonas corsicana]
MNRGPAILLSLLAASCCLLPSGCHFLLPEVSVQPIVHNPFPQLSRVAVAPFINLSDEPTVDGAQFAMAYFAELQSVRGFEVVPLGVTEQAIIQLGLFRVPAEAARDARRLAQHLGVDAVVVGAVTDFDPYYPPRCGMRVEWYSANAGFHPIPAGYGLPWGTPDEEYIPESLVFEAEMALAKEQLATQTPSCPPEPLPVHGPPLPGPLAPDALPRATPPAEPAPPADAEAMGGGEQDLGEPFVDAQQTAHQAPAEIDTTTATPGTTAPDGIAGVAGMFPPDWPDARGFTPPCPSPVRPVCQPSDSPVMTHTRVYHGHDPDFTAALASYVSFRDDARFGGWQGYLQRSDDFIRFCAHLHISEMLTARGGGGESRVVRRWSESR